MDREALRKLAEEATAGPWFVVGEPWNAGAPWIIAGSEDPHCAEPVCDLVLEIDHGECANAEANAAFIAAAREAVPALLDENDRLREALEFYADPDTYFAIAVFADAPCGDFADDFEELDGDLGHPGGGAWVKPGKRARAALAKDPA